MGVLRRLVGDSGVRRGASSRLALQHSRDGARPGLCAAAGGGNGAQVVPIDTDVDVLYLLPSLWSAGGVPCSDARSVAPLGRVRSSSAVRCAPLGRPDCGPRVDLVRNPCCARSSRRISALPDGRPNSFRGGVIVAPCSGTAAGEFLEGTPASVGGWLVTRRNDGACVGGGAGVIGRASSVFDSLSVPGTSCVRSSTRPPSVSTHGS